MVLIKERAFASSVRSKTGNAFKECIDGSKLPAVEEEGQHPKQTGKQPSSYHDTVSFFETESVLTFAYKD